jgi:hypothetical protein
LNLTRLLVLLSSPALVAAAIAGCSVVAESPTAATGAGGASSVTASSGAGGGASSGTTSATTTSSSGGGDAGIVDFLGAACTADADCGNALVCVKATDDDAIFGGGPAGGMCTRVCDADSDCPGTSSVCLQAGGGQPGRCALTCELGPPLGDLQAPLDPAKCRGRDDLRCGKVKGSLTACLPTCGSDAQCGPGRACDPRLAVCVSAPNVGLSTGESCDPTLDPPACAGTCIHFQFGETMCSSPCVLGGPAVGSSDCGGPEHGLCAFGPSDNGPGDFGFCTPSCASQNDCENPHFWCFTVPGYSEQVGLGYCFGAVPCPGGQGDCVDAEGHPLPSTCTDTPFGSYCLDTAFPLDGQGGGGAGP